MKVSKQVKKYEKHLSFRGYKKMNVNEGKSKYLSESERVLKAAEHLYVTSGYVIGAAGGGEIKRMVANAVEAAKYLTNFAVSLLRDDHEFASPELSKEIAGLKDLTSKLQIWESADIDEDSTESLQLEGVYIDPYEAEYLPRSLRSELTEGIDDVIVAELDDDPDAVSTIDVDGLPVQFNNEPLELDPFAVRMFRNNAELVDPPEVFDAVKDADKSVEPELEPGAADDLTVDDADREQVIDAIADGEIDAPIIQTEPEMDEEDEDDEETVALPASNFQEFANESKQLSKVTPKGQDILPPQFNGRPETDILKANANVANAPGLNLKMLEFLANSDI